jgi:hypothetical protein
LRIQEWPGGELSSRVQAEVRITPELLAHVRRGRKRIPLGNGLPSVELLGLPSYSLVRLRARDEEQLVSALPARAGAEGWHLPIGLLPVDPAFTREDLLSLARSERRSDLLEAVTAGAEPRATKRQHLWS